MEIFNKLYTQLSHTILHVLFAYTEVFDRIKRNKRIKSIKTVNRMFKVGIGQILKDITINEHVDVLCISNFSEGNLEISATLIDINDSEYGKFFIEKFHKLKEFIVNNQLTIVYDEVNKSYSLKGACGTFKYDDEEVVKILYLENKLTGFLTDTPNNLI